MVGVCAGLASAASGEDKKNSEIIEALRAEVAELRSTVARLQAEHGDDWLTEQRADEIRALVQDVLADADTRANLLQDGMTAGWDKGFFLGSADGNWLLRIGGQIQVRYAASFQDDAPDGEDDRYGFEVRRAKLKLKGHVVDPSWQSPGTSGAISIRPASTTSASSRSASTGTLPGTPSSGRPTRSRSPGGSATGRIPGTSPPMTRTPPGA
jgi:hypothetical protein